MPKFRFERNAFMLLDRILGGDRCENGDISEVIWGFFDLSSQDLLNAYEIVVRNKPEG